MSAARESLREKAKKLPETPGVYKFIDNKGRIIYVGKAGNIKKRVLSYFRAGKVSDAKTEMLVSNIHEIDFIVASSEAEALILEAGLIKDHSPRFNIELKDDKSYPFLKLTVNEKYPRLFVTRRKQNDGAEYYGPYVNVRLLKEALSFMKKVFPLRTCRKLKKKVCLEYHIEQCFGPCEGRIGQAEYLKIVDQLKTFLEGRKSDLTELLKKEMAEASENRQYEKAIEIKRRVEAITALRNLRYAANSPMTGELDELGRILGLRKAPSVIECFDISNIHGTQAVGSMVSFKDGLPNRKYYRKFRIKETAGIDDYSMMREVVRRRYARVLKEGGEMPDLILIDGGRGHLHAARTALDTAGAADIPVISLAKEFNHIYTEGRNRPLRLSPGSRILSLIQRIRDEAHRFAIEYHRQLRSKNSFETELRKIKGVGPAKERKLLRYFNAVSALQKASVEQIKEAGLDKKTALRVYEHYRKK